MGSGSFLKVLAKNFDVLAGYDCLFILLISPPCDSLVLGSAFSRHVFS
jgi:hypothetical protein